MIKKLYYTTREVSELTGKSHQSIDYWAKKLGVKIGRNGHYKYSETAVEIIKIKIGS